MDAVNIRRVTGYGFPYSYDLGNKYIGYEQSGKSMLYDGIMNHMQ